MKAEKRRLYSTRVVFYFFLVLTYTLTSLLSFTLNAQPSYAAASDDLRAYNSLVGFKKFCGIDGGGDGKVTWQDTKDLFDATNGTNNNGAALGSIGSYDAGASIITGHNFNKDLNGVVSCQAVAPRVMNLVTGLYGGAITPARSDQPHLAMQRFVLYLRDGGTTAAENLADPSDNDNPFGSDNGGQVTISEGAWGRFVENYLDRLIDDYEQKVSAIDNDSPAVAVGMLLPALNYCFDWVDNNNQTPLISISDKDLYGIRPPGGYPSERLFSQGEYKEAYFSKGDAGVGSAGEENAAIRSLKLEFKDYPAYSDPGWFTFGYAAPIFLSGAANRYDRGGNGRHLGGLVSCRDLTRNINFFKDLIVRGSGNKVKLNDEAEDTAQESGINTTPGGDAGSLGDETEPSCEGGTLDWVVCPIVNGLANLADTIVSQFLQPVLRVQILELPGPNADAQSQALYGAWRGFRNVANALLILALLAIIISTAFSEE